MHTFPMAGPARLRVRFGHGRVAIVATDRDDVVVDVQPADETSRHDRECAAATTVEQRGDRIVVEAPGDPLRGRRSLDITVSVPNGSHVDLVVAAADVNCNGPFGDVTITTSSGDVEVEQAESFQCRSSSGDTACRRVGGRTAVTSASGDVIVGIVGGDSDFTTASGDLIVEETVGDVNARTASGDIIVKTIGGSADVRTASGGVHLRSVRAGTIAVDTTSGEIKVGVADGVAAWLDLESRSGDVESELDDATPPSSDQPTVSIVARSTSGEISIVRAPAANPTHLGGQP